MSNKPAILIYLVMPEKACLVSREVKWKILMVILKYCTSKKNDILKSSNIMKGCILIIKMLVTKHMNLAELYNP